LEPTRSEKDKNSRNDLQGEKYHLSSVFWMFGNTRIKKFLLKPLNLYILTYSR